MPQSKPETGKLGHYQALSGTGSVEMEFPKYTISVSPYYQGRVRSGVRVTWKKK